MNKTVYLGLIVFMVLTMAGSAFGAVSVKYDKWYSLSQESSSVSGVTFIVGDTYIFQYNGTGASNVTWVLKAPDGTEAVYYGNPISLKFSQVGEYNLTVYAGGQTESYTIDVHYGPLGAYLALIGAGIAVGASGLGAAIGVGIAGAGGAAAMSENPGRFRTAIIFQALPQTQGIYGLLIGILILMYTHALASQLTVSVDVPVASGLLALGAGLAVGIAGLSAIGQGIVAGTGIGVTKKQGTFSKAMIFTVLPETQAIYGLLIAILLLQGLNNKSIIATPLGLGVGIAAVGVGLGIGLSGITAIGQGIAASSGSAATAQKSGTFSKSMIFAVLPETQSIYALLAGIIVINALAILGGTPKYSPYQLILVGIGVLGIGYSVGLAGISGIGQGITAGASAAAYVKRSDIWGKTMILSVMSETYAIFGLLMAILIMMALGVI